MQVLDAVRGAIQSGRLPVGYQLPTNRDLALQMGVSAMTVNRALSELTQMGLLRREVGRGTFVSSRTPRAERVEALTISIYVELDPGIVHSDYYFGPLIRGVIDEAIGTNVTFSFNRMEQALPDIGKADCMLFFAPYESHRPVIEQVLAARTPLVLLGSHWPDLVVPSVDCDNAAGTQAAFERLWQLGHRRIALITAIPAAPNTRDRRLGYRKALTDMGMTYDPNLDVQLPQPDQWWEEVPTVLDRLLDASDPITAVICGGKHIAHAALQHLQRRDLPVPEALSVIGFDEDPAPGAGTKAASSIIQPLHQMGKEALVMAKMCTHSLPPAGTHLQLLAPTLVDNGTIGPPPAR